uniref:Uncharacterized protein n=1 Tax=archaeon enrichment culture clone 1(2010) TaxID=795325 RepID=D9CGD4_9ARCH|nr:hypothetical protein pHA1_gp10 [archaeon enrichment culture clone 1(2010)]
MARKKTRVDAEEEKAEQVEIVTPESEFEKAYKRVPAPPTPLETAKQFTRTIIKPQEGGQSFLYAVTALIFMYALSMTERFWYDTLGQTAVIMFPAYLAMWTVVYLASFTTIAGIFALVANLFWIRASLGSGTLNARSMVYYAMALGLYTATSKMWVGLVAGYIAGVFVPALVTIMNIVGPMLLYLLMGSSIFLVLLAILFGYFFVLMAIGIGMFMVFSLVSAYWSRYASTITPLWRVFAVWIILTAKELLPPEVTFLFVAGYAIYAGIQAVLTTGGLYRSYQYLNALPALIIVALLPIGAVNSAMDTVLGIVDQTFSTIAPSMGEYSSILAGQYVAKWILSHIPPW